MSWDQSSGYDNSGYGNYYDPGYGNYDPNSQSFGGSQSFQSPYDASFGYDPYGQPNNPPQPSMPRQIYNPNEYVVNQQQSYQQPPPQPGISPRPPGPSSSPYIIPSGPPPSETPNGPSVNIQGFMGDQMNPMMANMAMQYGQDIVGKGQEELKKNLDKYVSIGQLKYYFAVDNSYVGKKLLLLLFPFSQSNWSIQYSQDEPVQPKFDINAPDLYIPSMAYVTYILIVGYILGLRSAFSPDLLATTASSCLVWLILELGCIYLTLTVMNISTNLCKWDVLSFSTYKYVVMIFTTLTGLITGSRQGYYLALLYLSLTIVFFLVRTLKLRIEPEVHGMQSHGKRKLYMLLFYAGLQPVFIWWMTSYFAPLPIPVV